MNLLTKDNEQFYKILDGLIDPILVLDEVRDNLGNTADYSVSFANRAALEWMKTSEKETSGLLLSEIFPLDNNKKLFKTLGQAARDGNSFRAKITVIKKNLRNRKLNRLIDVSFTRINGNVCINWKEVPSEIKTRKIKRKNKQSLIRDISERILAEEELQLREAQLDAFFANSPAILNLVDEEFRYINTDKLTPTYYGLNRETIKGKSVQELSQDFIEQTGKVMRRIIETGEPVLNEQFQAPVPGRGGEMAYWSTSMFRVPLGYEKWGVGVISLEITDMKNAQLQLERTIVELERSNNDLERFAYAASHDLQEPIRMMGSYAHILMKRYKGNLSPQADRYLKFMFEGAQRLQLLIRDLLNYARLRKEKMAFSKVELNSVLAIVIDDLKKSITETGAEITYRELPEIAADRNQLKQLFTNLVSNAIKFRKKDVKPKINISAEERGKEWLFLVEDNGIGIESEFTKLIFNVFQRLNDREEYPGVGVGLAICKRIVERHEGRIWVESEPGMGSRFYFSIPKKESKVLL